MCFTEISIIVCVRNGAPRVLPTLKALALQIIPKDVRCELLIVDNGSTDSTVELASTYWDSLGHPFPLSVFSSPFAGKSNALVVGYDNAKYELMLLCDDDNWLQPEYLKSVCEIYSAQPTIGLLGGYGKAILEPAEKPYWFDKWERIYVCGKHHDKDGFLDKFDVSIWGAGSVLRKKMWIFLRSNNFVFYNGTDGRATVAEDVELSKAITFTGHKLYFDERLWFYHDLRGGRVTWDNLLIQQIKNGRGTAVLYVYDIAFNCVLRGKLFLGLIFIRAMIGLTTLLVKSRHMKNNEPKQLFYENTLREIFYNPLKYGALYFQSLRWIEKISNTYPLFETGDVAPEYPSSFDGNTVTKLN